MTCPPEFEQMNRSAHLFQDRLVGGGLSNPVTDSLLADSVQELRRAGSAQHDDGNHRTVSVEMGNDRRSIHPWHFQIAKDGGDARSLLILFHQRNRRLSALG